MGARHSKRHREESTTTPTDSETISPEVKFEVVNGGGFFGALARGGEEDEDDVAFVGRTGVFHFCNECRGAIETGNGVRRYHCFGMSAASVLQLCAMALC